MGNYDFSPTPARVARDAYLKQMITYLYNSIPENRSLLIQKINEYGPHSGILAQEEKLLELLRKLEKGYESAWKAFAEEAEIKLFWLSSDNLEFQEMFFEAAQKKGLARKKWVICSI